MQEEMQEEVKAEVQVEEPKEQEKLLSAHQVQKIVQKEKALAAERARKDMEAEFQQRMEQQNQAQANQSAQNENVSREVDVAAITQQVREELNREMQQKQFEEEMQNVAKNYVSKVDLAREKYEDFDEVTAKFNPQKFPQLVYMVSGLENGGEVIYDLAKNRDKFTRIISLLEKAPEMAQEDLLELSQSIALNKKAQEQASNFDTPEPLDRLSPSRVSSSNGESSIRDFKSQSWLRG